MKPFDKNYFTEPNRNYIAPQMRMDGAVTSDAHGGGFSPTNYDTNPFSGTRTKFNLGKQASPFNPVGLPAPVNQLMPPALPILMPAGPMGNQPQPPIMGPSNPQMQSQFAQPPIQQPQQHTQQSQKQMQQQQGPGFNQFQTVMFTPAPPVVLPAGVEEPRLPLLRTRPGPMRPEELPVFAHTPLDVESANRSQSDMMTLPRESNTSKKSITGASPGLPYFAEPARKQREFRRGTLASGDQYEGEWRNGVPDGQGTLYYTNGDVFKGGMLRGVYNGQGELVRPNGDFVRGTWLIGIKDGLFEELWNDGSEYFKGSYQNGKRNGLGVLRMKDDKIYEGEFKDNIFHGHGKILFHNEKIKYRGEFREGQMSGRGVMLWLNDNALYDGEVVNGIRNGFGVFTDNKNNKFCGYFKNDKKHGEGYFMTEQGAKYLVKYDMDRELSKELVFGL